MYVLTYFLALVAGFFRIAITTVKANPDPLIGTEQSGAMPTAAGMLQQLTAFQNNASPAFGNWGLTVIPNVAAFTYTAQAMLGGFIRRMSTGGTVITDCTDTATNIINALPGAKVNQTFPCIIANLNSSTGVTVLAGTGVTLAGTNVIGGLSGRVFLGQITGSAAVTLTNCFGFSMGSGL